MGASCGCFSFLEEASKPVKSLGPDDKSSVPEAPAPAASSPAAGVPVPSDPDDVTRWEVGKGGVTDLSPNVPGRLLLRSPEVPKEATAPADGAEVTFNIEVFDLSARTRGPAALSCQSLRAQLGSGEVRLPEELEIIIPCLKPGGVFTAFCRSFGELGALPETGLWQSLSSCMGKEVLMKLELLEAQDLCLATLEGHERLEYAKGRKDAGGRYFKRGWFQAALERYSLTAEMLTHRDDIKDNSLWSQAQEVKSACELNAAACLLKLEKWRDVEAVCNAILRTNPANEKALFRRGKALLALGEADRAEKDLKKVLEVNAGNSEAKHLLQQARKESKGTKRERNVYAAMLQSE
ncbi:Peptidyl-prolyl cis-trans isomerase FKBP62 (PPIase FKBP62) (70 kDa peptidyl-prolyl isomerase) (FK506-binding protein 62) (AtFKBP62) (Immunophilin FKBP62) (Peptidylprolyl isomerase ROF1) (Protein ROTAMASE FKBP 1) (Rotamase) [Durusdinium trenchii]|uniref:Peptidylprolyl isomerase n=1 Tax=Durusdinium trenchii TaxID=1381693 RepID=A0ABP0QSJ5_9DINO